MADRDERDPLDRLRALGAATEELRPSAELDEAVMVAVSAQDDRLHRIESATRELDVAAPFADEVMSQLEVPSDRVVWSRIARATHDLRPSEGFTRAVMRA